MTTFASLFSGVGGTDAGFYASGWRPLWQTECDPYRRAVLRRHFGVPIVERVEHAPLLAAPVPDVLSADAPDSRLDVWWPMVSAVLDRREPATWLIFECSPTVRFDRVIADLAVRGFAFRVIFLSTRLTLVDPIESCGVRRRLVVVASRDVGAVDALCLSSAEVELDLQSAHPTVARESIECREFETGLCEGWTCACDCSPCVCDLTARLAAAIDAGCPNA